MKVDGRVLVPGDKSITHRALVLAALASGESAVEHPLTSWDTRSMAGALRQLGIPIAPLRPGRIVRVAGRGLHGLRQAKRSLDCGNSGTAARLLLGVLAGTDFSTRLTGDASLRRRPMRRVTGPLRQMGATFVEENGDGLPIVVTGGPLRALAYASPTASAQVKGSLLLAGLVGGVPVSVTEPGPSRDHSERMLTALGVPVLVDGPQVRIEPVTRLPAFSTVIPGDPSSAAFLALAASLAEDGKLVIEDVGINPTRTGFLSVLRRMGANVEVTGRGERLGEPVGDLVVRPSPLAGTVVQEMEVPTLIDEVPILAVAASRAQGETVFHGVAELRVKESDRLHLLATNLRRIGVEAEATADTLVVRGSDRPPRGRVETAGDHRLAMAFAVLGQLPGAAVELSECRSPLVSYPGFFQALDAVIRRG